MRKVFHILIHNCFFPISCVLTSGPVSTLATVSVHFCLCRLGLHTCHSVSPLLSLSPWSPHLPQCQSTSVSVALVSTLATVSVHFSLCRLGLHTCHSVSPLLSLSPWSPHLPQCQSTASASVSVTVRTVIPTAPLNESGIVNGHWRHSQNWCSYFFPLTGVEPESSDEHVSPVTTTPSSRASLSELNVTVHVLFSASTRPTGQLEGRKGRGHWLGVSPIGRLVLAVETACTCCTLIACQLHSDGSLCCLSVHCV